MLASLEYKVAFRGRLYVISAVAESITGELIFIRVRGRHSSLLFKLNGPDRWKDSSPPYVWECIEGNFNMPDGKEKVRFQKEFFAPLNVWVRSTDWKQYVAVSER